MSDEETVPIRSPPRLRGDTFPQHHASSSSSSFPSSRQQRQQRQRQPQTPVPPPSSGIQTRSCRRRQHDASAATTASAAAPSSQQPQRRARQRTTRLGGFLSWNKAVTDRSEEKRAIELAMRLEYGADILLEKLFAHLSQMPDDDDDDNDDDDDDDDEYDKGQTTNTKYNDPLHHPYNNNAKASSTTASMQHGMTLPAAAIAWLSSQLYPVSLEDNVSKSKNSEKNDTQQPKPLNEECCSLVSSFPEDLQRHHDHRHKHCSNDDDMMMMGLWLGGVAFRDRLSLLRFLLPRVKLLRITRGCWPPELPPGLRNNPPRSHSRRQQQQQQDDHDDNIAMTPPRRPGPPAELQCCSTISSVNSALTMEELVGYGNDTADSPRLAFLQFMHRLEHAPRMDMRVFPKIQVLVLESIPPPWILNLHLLQPTLQVLRVERAAIYHLPSLFFSKEQLRMQKNTRREQPLEERQNLHALLSSGLDPSRVAPPQKVILSLFPHLTHLKLDRCSLGELSGLTLTLSKLQNIQYLSLRHNDIRSERTALKALRNMPRLTSVDLRFNAIESLPHANLYLGGQIRTLKLSYNQLQTTRGGLDRCLALQELWLDGNCIQDIQDVSGLARLPELRLLGLHNNPVTTVGSPNYDPGWKIQLWTWFQEERRALTPLELPLLVDFVLQGVGNSRAIGTLLPTEREWEQIREESFSNNVVNPLRTVATAASDFTGTAVLPPTTLLCSTPLENQILTDSDADFVFDHFVTPFSSMPSSNAPVSISVRTSFNTIRHCRVTKKTKARRARIMDGPIGIAGDGGKRRSTKHHESQSNPLKTPVLESNKNMDVLASPNSTRSNRSLSFSLHDVLLSLQEAPPPPSEASSEKDENVEHNEQQKSPMISEGVNDTVKAHGHIPLSSFTDSMDTVGLLVSKKFSLNPFPDKDELDKGPTKEVTGTSNTQVGSDFSVVGVISTDGVIDRAEPLPQVRGVLSGGRGDTIREENKRYEEEEDNDKLFDVPNQSADTSTSQSDDRIFPGPRAKLATIKLYTGATTKIFDVLTSDWDELIKKASEGLIPDGLPKSPIDVIEQSISSACTQETRNGVGIAKVFPDQAVDLLEISAESALPLHPSSTNHSSASVSVGDPLGDQVAQLPIMLPEHVWSDDNSVLSSLGASRDDLPPSGLSKFQLSEENSFYDGPEYCREMKVVENLRLYFDVFVFPASVPDVPRCVLEELEDDKDDWQSISMLYPRIQLWPDDRRRLERSLVSASTLETDWAENRERLIRLWEEDVIPIGKPALRRLPPNRQIRLGFHGDKLFEGPDLDAYSECRKVILCLSSKALYVILRDDAVTSSHQQQVKKRRFPLPIDKDIFFRDAPWPHAVARHSLLDLEGICIGFEFQRLTLRFRNTSLPSSDPFVYLLLTSNKKSTVAIFQDVQKVAKELNDGVAPLTSKTNPPSIENDSNLVFDALSLAVAPNLLGTVIHYQIVRQFWRRGDRGTVRRVCVVTDSKILLLNEDYTADAHNLSEITVKKDKMGNVRYQIVDEAILKQVSEVQAAGADPKAITIVITPLSTLSRNHRWRLLCRDREGAERLVDDVRKALEIQ